MKNPQAKFCAFFVMLIVLLFLFACDHSKPLDRNINGNSDMLLAEQLKNQGSYDSAIVFFRKSIAKNLELHQYDLWLKSVMGMMDCFRSKGDITEAMRLAEQAQAIAMSNVDTVSTAYNNFIHKKALLYSDKRQFDQALSLYSRNIKIYTSIPGSVDTGLALSYNGTGTVFLMQNKYSEALGRYEKAVDIYTKGGNTKSTNFASSLQNIGIAYSMTGNYEKAEQFFLKSLKVNQDILNPTDSKLATLYLNMGRFYQIIRNDSKAIEYMKLAEDSYSRNNQSNSIEAGSLFLNMGVVYIYAADYQRAQSYLNKSLEIITAKAPDNLSNLLTIYLNMGFIAEKKGELELAKKHYLKGLAIGEKLSNSIKILRGLANVSYKLSDLKSANDYFEYALNKSIETYTEEHPETALTYLKYGDFLSVGGKSQSLFFLQKSLTLYREIFGEKNIDVSTAFYYIGLYYYRLGDFKNAIPYFQRSLIAGFQDFSSMDFADNPDFSRDNLNENLLNPLTVKATSLLLMYKSDTTRLDLLRSSVSSFNVSIKIIEMLRSTYQDEDSKLFISGNEKNTYSNALLAQVLLYKRTKNSEDFDKAFSLSEKGKSAVLLSHLRDKEAKNTGRIPKELLDRDASLKSEIYFYNKQIHDQKLSSNPDDAKVKLWNSKIFDLSRKQDELIKSIEKDYPLYYNMKYDNSVATIETIQKRLNPDQAIVEFSMTDSVLFAFAITKNKKQVITTSIGTGFFNNLRTVREQLTGKQFNNYSRDDFRIFSSASNQLYNTLLLPLQPTIKGKDLILIPDGELGYLSFDILLTSMPDTTKVTYKNISYLIKESALTYAPSATTFFTELNLSNNNNNGKIIAFGPSYTEQNQTLKNTDGSGSSLRDILSDLSNTQNEILSLEQYFNVTSLLGSKATEESFKRKAPDFKILHLAMHTLINNENSLYSKLVFFRPEGDTTEDGFLNASELVNMELHADMAVLSACNTGTGKMQKGEGIMSLSRDFFYAGVPGVVMTSWAVEDRTGIKLMDYFYKHIAEGKPRNIALRLAKIEYLENSDKLTSHPHYWAAYMNVGDISPLGKIGKRTSPLLVYGALATLFLLGVFFFIRRRNKK